MDQCISSIILFHSNFDDSRDGGIFISDFLRTILPALMGPILVAELLLICPGVKVLAFEDSVIFLEALPFARTFM